jgi:hypothetical protein
MTTTPASWTLEDAQQLYLEIGETIVFEEKHIIDTDRRQ